MALLSLATPFVTALTPWPIKLLVDHAIGGEGLPAWVPVASPAALIVVAAVSSLVLALLGTGLESLANLIWAEAGQRMVRRLSSDLMARMQRLSLRFHLRHEVGDLLARLSGDTWSIYTAAEGLLLLPVQQVLTLLIVGALAWQLDPTLCLISLTTAPLLALTAVLFGPPLRRRSQRQRTGEAKLHSFVHQTLGAISLVQAFGSGKRNRAQFDELADQAVSLSQRGVVLRGAFTLLTGVTTVVGLAAVIYFGANRVLSGALSAGGLLVFVAYYRTLQASSQTLMQTYGTYKVVQAHLDRVQDVLASDDELPTRPDARTLESLPHRQALGIRFEKVSFAYRPSQPVLENLDLSIAPGETVAIVGPTGAGKSTLVSLLPRLFDVRSGSVRIGGIDVRDLDLSSLRRHIAVVPQEPTLIHGTIADNIAFGDVLATLEQIVAAAIAAQADRFIRQLPEGYDTLLADQGAGLSGGQRQLLSIARAMLKNAPILILDEPSSALDAVTETALHEMLSSLNGRCTVVIAHRLSTIRRADRIVVLERGRIAQVGRHVQLLSDEGPYRRLYEAPASAEVPA